MEKIIITSLLVLFFYAAFQPHMIFGVIRRWLSFVPDWYQKSLFSCYICMCSIWGSMAYWIIWHQDIKDWLITICGSAGLNTIIFLFSTRDFD
jgi:hypothetical protein